MPDGFIPESLPPREPSPSPTEAPEQQAEIHVERAAEQMRERAGEQSSAPVAPTLPSSSSSATAMTPPREKDEFHVRIEQVLEEDMAEVIKDLTPAKQEEFRIAKEETAAKIRTLLDTVTVQFTAVLLLIRHWLTMIPGVSRFFLEQESKIKTDKIKRIAEELRAKRLG